jgi:hypothetical protein
MYNLNHGDFSVRLFSDQIIAMYLESKSEETKRNWNGFPVLNDLTQYQYLPAALIIPND